jgi:hypothetical protein
VGQLPYNLGAMFDSALNVANTLREFGYELLYAPAGKSFLTSDSPVFTLVPEGNRQATIGMGFGWPKVLVHFPLNKRVCLRLSRAVSEPDSFETSEHDLEQIKRITMANANRFLYSSEGLRKISRLFDQWGCKIEPGTNAFMPTPEASVRPRKSLLRILRERQKT